MLESRSRCCRLHNQRATHSPECQLFPSLSMFVAMSFSARLRRLWRSAAVCTPNRWQPFIAGALRFAQRARPKFRFFAQIMNRQPAMLCRESRNFYDSRRQQRFRSVTISAPVVMKRRGNLYDSLEKCFLRLVLGEPHFFPHLVRFKKLPRVEMLQPALELLVLFSGIHRVHVRFPLEFPSISWSRVIIAASKERTACKSRSHCLA